MNAKISFLILSMMLLFPFAHAQATNLQPVWDAINNLGLAIQAVQQDVQNIQAFGYQFAQDVIARLDALENRVGGIETIGVQFIDDTNVRITNVEVTQTSLQNQINTIQPTSFTRANIYEVSTFGGGTTTVFCNDANDILLTGYCAGGFFGSPPQVLGILNDDFSDGEYFSNPNWLVDSGFWSATTNELIGSSALGGSISTNINMPSGQDYFLSYRIRQMSPNVMGGFKWFANTTGYNANGYDLWLFDTGNILLTRFSGGNATVLANFGPFNLGQNYDVNINHMQTGNILVYIDGNLVGNVVDTTYSGGSKITFWTGNSAGVYAFDNVRVQNAGGLPAQTGYVNVSDLNQAMGIRCSSGWEARILCLTQ